MSCPDCFKGAVHNGTPHGHMEDLYGYPTYVADAPASSNSKSTILFICDAFGLGLVNNKLLADRYAADTGCRVLVPDIIPGGPVSTVCLEYMDNIMKPVAWTDVIGQVQRISTVAWAAYHFVPFVWRAAPSYGHPYCLKYARAVKADLPPGGKLGVAGFCWGGYSSTSLSKEPSVEGGTEPLIDAEFCAHPSSINKEMVLDALTTFKTPYAMAIGDKDFAFGYQSVLELQAAAKQKVGEESSNNYEIKVYPGCGHGFAVRAVPGNKVESDSAEEAAKQAINWYKKYLN